MDSNYPREPLQIPQAWVGNELAGSKDWIREFSEAEIDELESAARLALATGKNPAQLSAEDFDIPLLAQATNSWLNELNQGRGFMLLRGLPVKRWGRELSGIAYLGLGLQMGALASQNAAGDLLGHVRDSGEDPDDPAVRLYRTRRAQGFHTDGADVIGLLCLCTARSGGESRIVSSVSVFNEFMRRAPQLVPTLFQPFHFDRQEEQGEGEDPTFAIPLAYYDGAMLRMFFIGWYIRDAQRHPDVPRLTTGQSQAIDLIEELADELALDMDFQPGDIQLLKNSTILHGRAAFEDWPEPEDKRHLLRMWVNARQTGDPGANIVQEVPTTVGHRSDADLLETALQGKD